MGFSSQVQECPLKIKSLEATTPTLTFQETSLCDKTAEASLGYAKQLGEIPKATATKGKVQNSEPHYHPASCSHQGSAGGVWEPSSSRKNLVFLKADKCGFKSGFKSSQGRWH
jgi:hypothetical protein